MPKEAHHATHEEAAASVAEAEGEDPSALDAHEAAGALMMGSAITDELMRAFAAKGVKDAKGSYYVFPGVPMSKAALDKLAAGGKDSIDAKHAVWEQAKRVFGAQTKDRKVRGALLAQVYEALYSEAPAGVEAPKPSGPLLNKLLDVRVEPRETRMLRTNCHWFTPPDARQGGLADERYTRANSLGRQRFGSGDVKKSDRDLVEETLRVASVPCAHDPDQLMCFDSYAMCDYLVAKCKLAGLVDANSKLTAAEALAKGYLKDLIPVPDEMRSCAGATHLTREQLTIIVEHNHCAVALHGVLHGLSDRDVQAMLAVKDQLTMLPRADGVFGAVWDRMSLFTKKTLNNLPALLRSFLTVSLLRWVVCGVVRMTLVYTCIEAQGRDILKTAVKAVIKPIIAGALRAERGKVHAKADARKSRLASVLSAVARVFGMNKAPEGVAAILEQADASAGSEKHVDAAVDAIVDVMFATLKGNPSALLWSVVASLKADFFGSLLQKFVGFLTGFAEYAGTGWTWVVATATDAFSGACSLAGLDIVGLGAQAFKKVSLLRSYLNPHLVAVESGQMALNVVSEIAAWIPGGVALGKLTSAFAPMLEYMKPTAVWADVARLYLPTLQYISAELTKFVRLDWGQMEVGSLSLALVTYLPRCCGLISMTSEALLLDVPAALRRIPGYSEAAKLAAYVPGSGYASSALSKVTAGVALTANLLPGQAALGVALKAYTAKVGDASVCERFAAAAGEWLDTAVVAILIFQVMQDLGAAAYMVQFGKVPPLAYQSRCLRVFSNQVEPGRAGGAGINAVFEQAAREGGVEAKGEAAAAEIAAAYAAEANAAFDAMSEREDAAAAAAGTPPGAAAVGAAASAVGAAAGSAASALAGLAGSFRSLWGGGTQQGERVAPPHMCGGSAHPRRHGALSSSSPRRSARLQHKARAV